jgi:hypothetical protein
MNAISIAIPAHSRLKKSSAEISPAAVGETKAQTMLAAELAAMIPNLGRAADRSGAARPGWSRDTSARAG